jgi:hypothetical protein
MATIINKPVYGYTRERIITARELLGEDDASKGKQAPNALREFIEAGAKVQKEQNAAKNG